jgi:hypothetical protein
VAAAAAVAYGASSWQCPASTHASTQRVVTVLILFSTAKLQRTHTERTAAVLGAGGDEAGGWGPAALAAPSRANARGGACLRFGCSGAARKRSFE